MILRPLDSAVNAINRGNVEILPPCSKKPVLIAEFFPAFCERGEVIGVVLGVETTPDEEAGPCGEDVPVLPFVTAHLRWTLGGAVFTAECDYLNGTILGLTAESVRVCASYDVWRPHEENGCCPLPDLKVSAGFGYHARAHASNTSRLTRPIRALAGETARIQIPPFAVSFTILPVNDVALSAEVFGFCGGLRVRYEVQTPLSNMGKIFVDSVFPLFNGARYVEVQAANAGAFEAFVVFGLAL